MKERTQVITTDIKSITQNIETGKANSVGLSTTKNLTPDTILKQRGILDASRRMNWTAQGRYWRYPIFDFSGQVVVHRKKAVAKNADPKYLWDGEKGSALYYHTLHIREAITAAAGVLYIANGEPSVLAYHAAGIENVLCWFGETSVPPTLAKDLQGLGVSRVIYAPDNDDAGMKSAAKVRDYLSGTGVDFEALDLSQCVSAKGDFNDLWILTGFDASQAQSTLASLPPLILPMPQPTQARIGYALKSSGTPNKNGRVNRDRLLSDVLNYFASLPGWKRSGKGYAGKSPFREDSKASTGIMDNGTYQDFASGEKLSLSEVAEKIGLNLDSYRERSASRRRAVSTAPDTQSTQPSQPPFSLASAPLIQLEELTGQSVDVQYVTELDVTLNKGDLLLKSDTGTGKSTLIARQTARYKRVLFITHRTSLSAAQARAYNLENYKGLEARQLRQIDRLTICANSLPKLIEMGQAAPRFDVVILDESEQLLAHFGGKTFEGKRQNATATYEAFCAIVQRAGRVICADADMSPVTLKWLVSNRPDSIAKQVIINTHARQRGSLTIYNDKSAAIQAGLAIADNAATPVAFATTKKQAHIIAKHAIERYGDDSVLIITQDTNTLENKPVRAFLDNPNQEISKYKVIVYSATLGSGIDIQTPVAAVVGIFASEPHTAPEIHQMINRCRNASQILLYVQAIEGNREIDWSVLYQNGQKTAGATAAAVGFNSEGIAVMRPAHSAMLSLLSQLEARANVSKNQLAAHAYQLARGYSETVFQDGRAAAFQKMLEAHAEQYELENKRLILASSPIDDNQFDALRESGNITAQARAGHTRWQMEKAAGQGLTEAVYPFVRTPTQRANIYLLADTKHATVPELKNRDKLEAALPVHQRHHHTRRVLLLQDFVATFWGSLEAFNADTILERDHIAAKMEKFRAMHDDTLKGVFARRNDLSDNPVAILRWLLAQMGLQLESRQIMENGSRRRVYALEGDTTTFMMQLADQNRARIEADRALLKTRNNIFIGSYHVLSNRNHQPMDYDQWHAQIDAIPI